MYNPYMYLSYHTGAIITRNLYIFYPIFEDHFFVFKEVFSENYVLMYGLYSRAVCNQEPVMMARVQYIIFSCLSLTHIEKAIIKGKKCETIYFKCLT